MYLPDIHAKMDRRNISISCMRMAEEKQHLKVMLNFQMGTCHENNIIYFDIDFNVLNDSMLLYPSLYKTR